MRWSWALLWITGPVAWGEELQRLGAAQFKGDVAKPQNISALDLMGNFLVIGTDEGTKLQIL